MKIAPNDKYCLIDPGRGYGDNLQKVITYGNNESTVKCTVTGTVRKMYNAHLYNTIESRFKGVALNNAAVAKIGTHQRKR